MGGILMKWIEVHTVTRGRLLPTLTYLIHLSGLKLGWGIELVFGKMLGVVIYHYLRSFRGYIESLATKIV